MTARRLGEGRAPALRQMVHAHSRRSMPTSCSKGLHYGAHAPVPPWDCRPAIVGGAVLRFSGPPRWRDVLSNLQYQRHTPHRCGAHADDDQNCPYLKHSCNHALSSYSETRASIDDMPIALTASEIGDFQARHGEPDFCDCVQCAKGSGAPSAPPSNRRA